MAQYTCYPFPAIVGQEDLKRCLILCAIDPTIGGILIRGDKGTAKSTAARGLTKTLPLITVRYNPKLDALDPYNQQPSPKHKPKENNDSVDDDDDDDDGDYNESRKIPTPFVDLPIGATEDRLLGSLDFSKTMQEGGKRIFQPGLLATANRGILYVDEVNLLPAHLVDVMLDAAAMGTHTVQRDGISISHPAKFMLIGTMNPEEGELRPQLLDRFGLMLDVVAPMDAVERSEIIRQRIAFERNPETFSQKWQKIEQELTEKIQSARTLLPHVTVSDSLMLLISEICCKFMIGSLRADITLYKTASALAAREERTIVDADDIRQASRWALAHRRGHRQKQSESQQQSEQDLKNTDDEILDELINDSSDNRSQGNDKGEVSEKNEQIPKDEKPSGTDKNNGDNIPSSKGSSNNKDQNMQENFQACKPDQIKKLKLVQQLKGQAGSGCRNKLSNNGHQQRGYYVRSIQTNDAVDLDLDCTLKASIVNGLNPETGQPIIYPENWRKKVRNCTTDTIILFVVDASGSMSARQRMEAVKGTVLALLTDAYQQRDRVGVIIFRGIQAEVILEPTRSVELAEKELARLPTGGRTPLAHALVLTKETIRRLRRYEADQAILLIVLSDGKANVPLPDSSSSSSSFTAGDPWVQTEQVATQLSTLDIPTLMIDTEISRVRCGRGKELAEALRASYLRLDEITTDGLVYTIRQAV